MHSRGYGALARGFLLPARDSLEKGLVLADSVFRRIVKWKELSNRTLLILKKTGEEKGYLLTSRVLVSLHRVHSVNKLWRRDSSDDFLAGETPEDNLFCFPREQDASRNVPSEEELVIAVNHENFWSSVTCLA